MKTSLVVLLVLLCQGLFGLNVELSVKECAGVGSDGYPIRTVVPVKGGLYQNTSSFRLTDASGNTVPAQFEVLSRRYLGDKSITNVGVTYMPTVSAFAGTGTGISKYYFKDDGTGNSTSTGLVVTEGADVITVVTGNSFKFTVKKNGFNIIDQAWYDPNNGSDFSSAKLVIKSNAKGGGEFKGRLPGDIQYDADRSDIKVEVEESGPVKAVIRVEALTKYYSTTDHTHGWAIRIYAYAGKSFVKVDYQLQNSAKTKQLGWPLYFHALNLDLDLNLPNSVTVKAGLGNGSVYSGSLGSGICLSQRKHNLFNVYGVDGAGDTTTVLATGDRPEGFLDIDNGNIGVAVQTRNFWRMYPNGLKINSDKKLSVQLFPEWSCQINMAVENPVFNRTHLYWLADMQHVYKEVVLNFHPGAISNAQLLSFAKTVDFHPVASIPVAYISSAGSSLDLEGIIPFSTKLSGADTRLPSDPSSDQLGWYYYVLNGRRIGTAQGGGWPAGGGQFWATENPSDWFTSEREAIGEMNIRPQWMAQYNFNNDYPSLYLGMNDCGGIIPPRFDPYNWRVENCGGDQMDADVLAGTGGMVGIFAGDYCSSIDDSHFWQYHIADSYWMTGNPWQKDYYRFIVEFRKNMIGNYPYMARFGGHPLADVLQALNATGDTSMARMLKENILYNRNNCVRPQYGDFSSLGYGLVGASSWQFGFGARPLIDYLSQVKDSDPQAWAEGFQLLSAYMSWNLVWGNFNYYSWAPEHGNSYSGSFTLLDPQAWYYWHTGLRTFLDQANLYINQGITVENGVGWGEKPMVESGITYPWNGEYCGRWIQFVRENTRTDAVPPAAVSNLSLARTGSQCTLRWTVPADARQYHIVWGDKPISAEATDNTQFLNWWAAKTVGKNLTIASGAEDQVTFTVPAAGLLFAAMFTFDSSCNMSPMSNVARSDATPATAPANFTATAASSQKVTLNWSASNDPESGIWYYNVYRNNTLIASVKELSFADDGLVESTGYDYAVAAVSGSNAEGIRSEQHVITPVDNAAPAIVTVRAISTLPEVTVVFSENLDSMSAKTTANYRITRGCNIQSAVLQADRRTVVLTCDALIFDSTYVLTVNGVKDVAVASNTASNVTAAFVHRGPLLITNTKEPFSRWDVFTTEVSVFSDWEAKMDVIPAQYLGLPLLITGTTADKYYDETDSMAAFTSNKALMVYVMLESAQNRPYWLTSGFTLNGDSIGNGFVVWEATFPAGRITLPGGGLNVAGSNYFVVVRPLDSSWVSTEDTASGNEYIDGMSTCPNPFNPQVSITVQCGKMIDPGKQVPDVRIFNMQGRLVAKLAPSGIKRAGRSAKYEYIWNGAGYASGAYLVSANAQGKTWKKAVVLLK